MENPKKKKTFSFKIFENPPKFYPIFFFEKNIFSRPPGLTTNPGLSNRGVVIFFWQNFAGFSTNFGKKIFFGLSIGALRGDFTSNLAFSGHFRPF